MVDNEKREVAGWWLWMLGLVAVAFIVLGALSYMGAISSVFVERKVFEQSYQRSEGYKERIAILEASLAELRARQHQANLPEATKAEIGTQIAAITAQLNAARRQQ